MTARPPTESAVWSGSPVAVTATFATAGFVTAATFTRMPSLRDQVDASLAELSFALLCVGLGSVVAMPWTGRMTDRWSSAATVRVFGLVGAAALSVAAFLTSVTALALCFLFVGVGVGVWDVSMNVQGHAVETRRRRVLMPGWHAAYSFGSVGGALFGAGCAWLGVTVGVQLPVTSVLALGVLALTTTRFVDDSLPAVTIQSSASPSGTTPPRASPSGRADEATTAPRRGITATELVVGLIVLATAVGEGAANDWLGLLLVDERGLPESFGGAALAGFNLTMGIGRLIGGRLIASLGRVPVLRASGLAAAGGVLLLCLTESPVTALLGAAAWGLGLAVVFPSGMSAAGDIDGRGARAIGVVSTIGYGGFLLGAPLIGQLTRVVPLDRALLVVAAAGILIASLAYVARERERSDLSRS